MIGKIMVLLDILHNNQKYSLGNIIFFNLELFISVYKSLGNKNCTYADQHCLHDINKFNVNVAVQKDIYESIPY